MEIGKNTLTFNTEVGHVCGLLDNAVLQLLAIPVNTYRGLQILIYPTSPFSLRVVARETMKNKEGTKSKLYTGEMSSRPGK